MTCLQEEVSMTQTAEKLGSVVSLTDPKRLEKRAQKFRGHRVSACDLAEGELIALGRHAGIGRFEASVENLSPHGAALRVPAGIEKGLLLAGDRLVGLRIEFS